MQALALVGAGKVDDGGGAAPERGAAAGVKVVGGGGAGHVQVKMGVGVDKAGEQQAAGHVDHLVGAADPASHLEDLLPLQQHVRPLHAAAGDHAAALEQSFHASFAPLIELMPV